MNKKKKGFPELWISKRFYYLNDVKSVTEAWEEKIKNLKEVEVISHKMNTEGSSGCSRISIMYQEWE